MHRRIVVRVIALLLLGAVMNVAVAWTLAFFAGDFENRDDVAIAPVKTDDEGWVTHWWGVTRSRAFGIRVYGCTWASEDSLIRSDFEGWARPETIIPYWSNFVPPSQAFLQSDAEESYLQRETAAGWPMLSLFSWLEVDWESGSVTDHKYGFNAGKFESGSGLPRMLPLHPIAIGFAVNTLFYAVVLWFPVLAFQTTRRSLRRRAGRCVKCGYDLRGSDHAVCPECGATTRLKE